jgi:spermidine synthase
MSASAVPVNATGVPFHTRWVVWALAGERRGDVRFVLPLCFLLSGFAALVYQTAWTRQFALVFGTSELAVATVLAAYMGGLAVGAWLAERWLPRVTRPVLVYAGLELGIAASAVTLVPALLWLSEWLLRTLFGGQPGPPDSAHTALSLFYLMSAFGVLAVPTVLMGATLPMLARHSVRTDSQIGSHIGLLYSMNTLGAVGGALVTAFWLLPQLGLMRSVWVAAGTNAAVFVLAAMLARGRADVASATKRELSTPPADASMSTGPVSSGSGLASSVRQLLPLSRAPSWILPLMLLSGAVAFFHEVLWTRMLSHILGSSLYAFGVMVATFLTGIALGGAIGALVARTRVLAVHAFVIAQLGCAMAAAGAFLLLDHAIPPPHRLAATASFGAVVMLPMTFFIGTTFPLAVRILAENAESAAAVSARVYAWNTVGAIVGSLAAAFVLIPWLRFEGAIQIAVIATCALAVAAAWMLTRLRMAFAAFSGIAALGICFAFQPDPPERLLRASPLNIASDGRMRHYDVGKSASVVVLEQDGGLVLRTNGLPEAMMESPGMPPRFGGEFWLTPLATLARPGTQSMLIVGYGGGVLVEVVPPSVRTIDVIEIEPKVIEANRALGAHRRVDPLRDPRLTIISNDARGALQLTRRKYDAIVSQPSHPWTAGASHLYTLEFMQQARTHLNDDGVFVQWMNVAFLDEALLRSLTATLLQAFGEVRVYRPDPNTLIFLASARPLDVETQLVATGLPLATAREHFARIGIHSVEDVVAALVLDAEGARSLAAGASVITDDRNRIATSSVHDFGLALSATEAGHLLAPYDPVQKPDSWVFEQYRDALSFPYIARRIALFAAVDASAPDRIEAISRVMAGTPAAHEINETLRAARGDPEAAGQLAREALLREEAAPVLQARALADANDWTALSQRDEQLAQVPWTAPWKIDAVLLRAHWRSRASAPDLQRQLGNECISIIDEAIAAHSAVALYGLRARCAQQAHRYDAVIESIWSYGNGLYSNALRQGPERRLLVQQNLQTLIVALEKNLPPDAEGAPTPRFDRARRDEVIRKLRDRIGWLEST